MKRMSIVVTCLAFLGYSALPAADWGIKTELQTDSALGGVSLSPRADMTVTLEAGIAWERNADLKPNDLIVRNGWYWTLHTAGRRKLSLLTALQLYRIDADYAKFTVPGISFGFEYDIRTNAGPSFFIESGVQFAHKTIHSRYHGELVSVYYSESWYAPVIWAGAGWKIAISSSP